MGAAQACLQARAQVERIAAWRVQVAKARGLHGRSTQKLLDILVAWPLVSAPLVAERSGLSRATAQRQLAWLGERGMIREVTGQARYRLWEAVL